MATTRIGSGVMATTHHMKGAGTPMAAIATDLTTTVTTETPIEGITITKTLPTMVEGGLVEDT